jgi:uncharacterized protein YecE (DUF72 family)
MIDIRVGCCGFPVGRSAYLRDFDLVEVQQTFYQPPRPETLRRWRAEAPPRFEFALKAWQLITHHPSSPTYRRLRQPIPEAARGHYGAFRATAEVQLAWEVTLEAARCLDARLIVFQCPASFRPEPENLANVLRFFARARADAPGIALAWEPRGDWPRETMARLATELGLVPVVDPFQATPFEGSIRYFRLHGVTGYRYRYSDEDLHRLLGWCSGTTYCLFNNLTMAEDANRFRSLIETS